MPAASSASLFRDGAAGGEGWGGGGAMQNKPDPVQLTYADFKAAASQTPASRASVCTQQPETPGTAGASDPSPGCPGSPVPWLRELWGRLGSRRLRRVGRRPGRRQLQRCPCTRDRRPSSSSPFLRRPRRAQGGLPRRLWAGEDRAMDTGHFPPLCVQTRGAGSRPPPAGPASFLPETHGQAGSWAFLSVRQPAGLCSAACSSTPF